jgi:hypothetical protein
MAGWDLPTTLFGQPVTITVEWPKGLPFQFASETEMRLLTLDEPMRIQP